MFHRGGFLQVECLKGKYSGQKLKLPVISNKAPTKSAVLAINPEIKFNITKISKVKPTINRIVLSVFPMFFFIRLAFS